MMSHRTPLSPRTLQMFSLIEKYLASGLSRRVFCEQERLTFPTFHYWRRKYAAHRRERETPTTAHPDFIPLCVVPSAPTQWVIEYPSGVILRLSGTVDLDVVSRLVHSIGRTAPRPCEPMEAPAEGDHSKFSILGKLNLIFLLQLLT